MVLSGEKQPEPPMDPVVPDLDMSDDSPGLTSDPSAPAGNVGAPPPELRRSVRDRRPPERFM